MKNKNLLIIIISIIVIIASIITITILLVNYNSTNSSNNSKQLETNEDTINNNENKSTKLDIDLTKYTDQLKYSSNTNYYRLVRNNNKFGFINSYTGEEIIPCKYDKLSCLFIFEKDDKEYDFAYFCNNNKWGLVSGNGKEVYFDKQDSDNFTNYISDRLYSDFSNPEYFIGAFNEDLYQFTTKNLETLLEYNPPEQFDFLTAEKGEYQPITAEEDEYQDLYSLTLYNAEGIDYYQLFIYDDENIINYDIMDHNSCYTMFYPSFYTINNPYFSTQVTTLIMNDEYKISHYKELLPFAIDYQGYELFETYDITPTNLYIKTYKSGYIPFCNMKEEIQGYYNTTTGERVIVTKGPFEILDVRDEGNILIIKNHNSYENNISPILFKTKDGNTILEAFDIELLGENSIVQLLDGKYVLVNSSGNIISSEYDLISTTQSDYYNYSSYYDPAYLLKSQGVWGDLYSSYYNNNNLYDYSDNYYEDHDDYNNYDIINLD